MSAFTIDDLDDTVKAGLRARASLHGWSVEQEARVILSEAVAEMPPQTEGLGQAIRRLFEPLGGMELELPSREKMPDPPTFD
jgi:plasmid stability protein